MIASLIKFSRKRRNTPQVISILFLLCLAILPGQVILPGHASEIIPVHAMAMHGSPKYGENFSHFDYVNPDAPKGGQIKLVAIGNFDTFNGFIPKGIPASGTGLLYDTLTVNGTEEAFTQYGLIAEKIEIPADRSWVIFHINPKAKFADGHAITAEDVEFTFKTLLEKGKPFYRYYYGSVKSVSVLDKYRIRFELGTDNQELALILGQLVVLPKHYWQDIDFEKADLTNPLGSGPYKLEKYSAGKRVMYERREDYWAKDLPVNRGRYNFGKVVYEYFLDPTVALEAFKSGSYDFRSENNSKFWATQYEGPLFKAKKIITEEIDHERPVGLQGFAFNLRKPLFQDRALRRAMAYAFDFEWSNKNLFYGQYKRTLSYFQNTELAATHLPSKAELSILTPFKDNLPSEIFNQVYDLPITKGEGKARKNLRKAIKQLKTAGYVIKNNHLYSPAGDRVEFDFLIHQSQWERIVLPFVKNLKVLGITANLRRVDVNQYVERIRKFDFDMIIGNFGQSLSPGNEQREFWHSSSANIPDSRNVIGIQDPVIDQLIDLIIAAPNREQLVIRSKALDRVLQWNHFTIPNWHVSYHRLAYSKKLVHPKSLPKYDVDLFSWWINPQSTATNTTSQKGH
ncbi:MAG: extracellular solute-binding protein [Pseudomonadales bacterium]|nr:extracellular solute-binding protein [Pseudomonadales bacterium]